MFEDHALNPFPHKPCGLQSHSFPQHSDFQEHICCVIAELSVLATGHMSRNTGSAAFSAAGFRRCRSPWGREGFVSCTGVPSGGGERG